MTKVGMDICFMLKIPPKGKDSFSVADIMNKYRYYEKQGDKDMAELCIYLAEDFVQDAYKFLVRGKEWEQILKR